METQCNAILSDLLSGKTITPMEALRDHGCFRLGARIYDLRERGYQIDREMVEDDGKRFASYYMTPEERARHA